jgi:hypothetical protein
LPEQQVRLFTGGLPDAIRVDVELQAPQDLQHAKALARAYEQRSSVLAAANIGGRPPRSPTCFHQHSGSSVTTRWLCSTPGRPLLHHRRTHHPRQPLPLPSSSRN